MLNNNKDETQNNYTFEYMFLGRLQSDVEYFLGHGAQNEKHLYYDTIEEHLTEMRKHMNAFPGNAKPKWITEVDIQNYEALVKQAKKGNKNVI